MPAPITTTSARWSRVARGRSGAGAVAIHSDSVLPGRERSGSVMAPVRAVELGGSRALAPSQPRRPPAEVDDAPGCPPGAQGGARGVGARGPVHAAAGVCRRRGEVEVLDRRLGAAQSGQRAKDELLVDLRRPVVDRPGDEVGVAPLEGLRGGDVAPADEFLETWRAGLDLALDAVGEQLGVGLALVPRQLAGGVAPRAPRDVRVRPE